MEKVTRLLRAMSIVNCCRNLRPTGAIVEIEQ